MSHDRVPLGPRPAPAAGRRWAVGLVAALLLCVLTPVARADSLVVTVPQERQELDAAPGWVTLAFDEDVEPGSAKVLVQDSGGRNVTTGQLIVEGTNVTTQLETGLPRDTYTVRYRVVSSADPYGGAYQFSYGRGSFTDLPDRTWSGAEDEPPVLSNDDPNATTSAPPPSPRPTRSEPGVEVSKGTSTDEPSEPPSTDPTPTTPTAGTSDEPTGPATSAAGSPVPSSPSSEAVPDGGGGSWGTVAGVAAAAVLVGALGAALLWWRARRAGGHS